MIAHDDVFGQDTDVVDGDPFDFATLPDRIVPVWKDGAKVVPFA